MNSKSRQTSVVAFRADASLEIGSGHVMRCLTLAGELGARGADCRFICREHPGNLMDYIREKGYIAHNLSSSGVANNKPADGEHAVYASWLGTSQEVDACQSANVLKQWQPDWLVVDHYALDATWEKIAKPESTKLLVIDDLADRQHIADLLLDQNLGRTDADYEPLLPADCTILTGPNYALLRPEFAELREYSLCRREKAPAVRRVLVSIGGVDKDNATEQVLEALASSGLSEDIQITVVMGSHAPHLEAVKAKATDMAMPTRVLVNVQNMAILMADADLSIGAAGSTSWERCCLGLPSIVVVLAENQRAGARALVAAGAALAVESPEELIHSLPCLLEQAQDNMAVISTRAAEVCEGSGTQAVAQLMVEAEG